MATSKKWIIIILIIGTLSLLPQPAEAGIIDWWCDKVGWFCTVSLTDNSGNVTINIDQKNGLINYKREDQQINVTLELMPSLSYISANNTLWYVVDDKNIKFGWNRTFQVALSVSDKAIPARYIISSGKPIRLDHYNNIITSESKTYFRCEPFGCEQITYETIDFSDICRQTISTDIVTGNNTLIFDPICSFNQINSNTIELDFLAYYNSTSKFISIDPTITLVDVAGRVSNVNNITKNNNFTHLSFGSNSIDFINASNVLLYLPFDINDTTNFNQTNPSSQNASALSDYSQFKHKRSEWDNMTLDNGYIGYGIKMNGVTSGLLFNDANTLGIPANVGYTVSLWFKGTDTDEAFQNLFAKRTSATTPVSSANGLRGFIWEDGAIPVITVDNKEAGVLVEHRYNATDSIWNGQWQHFVFGRNQSTVYGFLNGTQIINGIDTSMGNLSTSVRLGIGVNVIATGSMVGSGSLNGTIDEVLFINTSLSAAQIQALYNNQSSRFFPQGQQTFPADTSTFSTTDNRVNITTSTETFHNSTIQVRIGGASIDNYSTDSLPYVPEFWYRFDNYTNENETFVVDYGSRSMNLTCILCPANTQGKYFSSKYFNSTNSFNGTDSDILNNITILAWVNNTPSGGAFASVIAKYEPPTLTDGEWILELSDTNALYFTAGTSSSFSIPTLVSGTWSFIGVTFNEDTNTLLFYINGAPVSTIGGSNPGIALIDDTEIIRVPETDGHINNLSIDELMVFQRILTADEINQIYTKGGFNYAYSPYQITDKTIPLTTHNTSARANYSVIDFLFTAGNGTYNFITPTLRNNITLDSYTFTAAPGGDSCTYTSGNWNVNCWDNCTITSNVAINTGSNITISGVGSFVVNAANITGYRQLITKGLNSSSRCLVSILNKGSIR